MKRFIYISIFCLLIPIVSSLGQNTPVAKTDSATSVVVKKEAPAKTKTVSSFKPNPKTAMLLSCFIPGGGQIYNRSYWKAPIVWGGYAALIYAISWNGGKYNEYHKAYISIKDENLSTNEWQTYIPEGKTGDDATKAWLTMALEQKNNYFRRNRDYGIIGIIGFYGLTILDSYVDAQLYDFDISPDLSLHIEPVLLNGSTNTDNSVGVRCMLTF